MFFAQRYTLHNDGTSTNLTAGVASEGPLNVQINGDGQVVIQGHDNHADETGFSLGSTSTPMQLNIVIMPGDQLFATYLGNGAANVSVAFWSAAH